MTLNELKKAHDTNKPDAGNAYRVLKMNAHVKAHIDQHLKNHRFFQLNYFNKDFNDYVVVAIENGNETQFMYIAERLTADRLLEEINAVDQLDAFYIFHTKNGHKFAVVEYDDDTFIARIDE